MPHGAEILARAFKQSGPGTRYSDDNPHLGENMQRQMLRQMLIALVLQSVLFSLPSFAESASQLQFAQSGNLINSRFTDQLSSDKKLSKIGASAQMQRQSLQWWNIDQKATEILKSRSAESFLSERGKPSLEPLLVRLNVSTRFGQTDQALAVIEELTKLNPPPDKHILSSAADFLIGREMWPLAKRFLTSFPAAEPGWGYVYVKHQSKSASFQQLDGWLASQFAKTQATYWLKERMRYRKDQGKADELMAEFKNDIGKNPTDLAKATAVIDAVSPGSAAALDWMATACKPKLAFESLMVAEKLSLAQSPKAATALYERSLSLPFSDADRKAMIDYLHRQTAMPMVDQSSKNLQSMLRSWTKSSLARAYQAQGLSKKAQPLIEELAVSSAGGLAMPGFSQFAGQVQKGSGARVFETAIEKAEPGKKDSSDYWLSRAEYYVGRNEAAQAKESFEKSLALAVDVKSDAGARTRLNVINSYARFINKQSGGDLTSAMKLLRSQFEQASLGGDYSAGLVREMVFYDNDISHLLPANDSRLWDYLEARSILGQYDSQLLRKMGGTISSGGEQTFTSKATQLSNSKNATGKFYIGDALLRISRDNYLPEAVRKHCLEKSIPLLKNAYAELTPSLERDLAHFAYFDALIETNNWQQADKLLSRGKATTTDTLVVGLSRLAVAAARAKNFDQALKFWQEKDQVDPMNLQYMDELCKYGMKIQLTNYYNSKASGTIRKLALDKLK